MEKIEKMLTPVSSCINSCTNNEFIYFCTGCSFCSLPRSEELQLDYLISLQNYLLTAIMCLKIDSACLKKFFLFATTFLFRHCILIPQKQFLDVTVLIVCACGSFKHAF